jgi:DNA polymerase-3 subunit epsilon
VVSEPAVSVQRVRANKYAGTCAVCDTEVESGAGLLIGAPGRRQTVCAPCRPTPPARGDHDGWHRTALASLDLETTGVDPWTDRVLSYALLGDRGDDVCGLVDPGVEIPAASAAVHGLTAESLAGAPGPGQAIAEIAAWVQDLVERRIGLVVFNAPYDLTMLRAEIDRWGLDQPAWDHLLVVDPFVIDWGIERGRLGARRLSDVAQYYDVVLDNAHDAAADARAARSVAHEIGRCHPDVAAHSLEQLMQHQRDWYAERADDWNAYARTSGRSLDDPRGWPLSRVPSRWGRARARILDVLPLRRHRRGLDRSPLDRSGGHAMEWSIIGATVLAAVAVAGVLRRRRGGRRDFGERFGGFGGSVS